MCVCAIFAKSAHFLLVKILALLRLVVVVRNVEHFKLNFHRQRLKRTISAAVTYIIFFSEFVITMSEMARITFGTVTSLHEMFADLGFEQYI